MHDPMVIQVRTLVVALVAGLLSFLSPCVLPIVPPYLAYMSGVSMGEIVKVKLSDRIKRIELIGKHVNVQAFRERLDHSSSDGSMAMTRIR